KEKSDCIKDSVYKYDGCSGTNFNRPGVKAMLEEIKRANLDCVIVKDFSRFSRDYIELGAYIDQIFPFMGIRFISINDGYDSAACEGGIGSLDISFRNLLYDLYSKDLSVKVKSSFAVKRENGQYISANCPFGYKKAEEDRHMLLIEEQEARIVRRIFEMAMEGMTSTQIARTLNREGVKAPAALKQEKGKSEKAPKGKGFFWSSSGICRILKNEAYAGAMVYDKYYKKEVGGSNHLRPQYTWKVMQDHHEPIVDREMFEAVQRKRRGSRERQTGPKHPLAGKLVCESCGRNLYLRKGANPYFCCPSLYDVPGDACVRKVNAMFLEQYVLYEIQQKNQGLSDEELLKDGQELLKELVPQLIERINIRDEQQIRICWREQQ
ncbi:MAG: recombinase family protein, partial [Bacillota bacterium]|nr:recombinase family protein [Bacillota bacterium]